MGTRRTLICPECGLVELVDTDRCPSCGLTALDPGDPANRDAIDEAIALRRQLLTPRWFFIGMFVVGALAFLGGAWLGKDPAVGQLFAYVAIIAWAVVMTGVIRARMPLGWKDAIENHRTMSGERAIGRARWRSATMIAMGVCLVFAGITIAVGVDALAYQRSDTFARPWRIVTAMFAHAGVAHLLGNMLALYLYGLPVDLRVGRARTIIILAIAGVAASLAQAQYSSEPMVGFSGAIYGLIGAVLALMPRRPALLVMQGVAIPMPMWLWSLFMIPLFTFTAWIDHRTHVAWVAHLAGLVTGFVVALAMRHTPPTPELELFEAQRQRRLDRIASR